ncbi:MAG: hypothetical protein V4580_01870 [Bacteroidota bacterium]
MSILHNIIPASQRSFDYIGASSNFVADSRHAALVLFNGAKLRLLDINNWTKLYEGSHTEFRLTDRYGNLLQTSTPHVGDLIRMRLPILPNSSEERFGWVRIENFESTKDLLKDEDMFGFCVRPVDGPLDVDSVDDYKYNSEVISYFLLFRKASTIMAIERDRDQMAHGSSPSLVKKIKNILHEILASMKLSRSRWTRLMDGLLKPSFN